MQDGNLAKGWMALAGVTLVAVGLLGFVENPLVYRDDALFTAGAVHSIVHLGTGLIALYIAFALRGEQLANGVLGFGILYAIIFIAVLLSPDLFGLFETATNAVGHIIHAALAVVSLAVGYMVRNRESAPTAGR